MQYYRLSHYLARRATQVSRLGKTKAQSRSTLFRHVLPGEVVADADDPGLKYLFVASRVKDTNAASPRSAKPKNEQKGSALS